MAALPLLPALNSKRDWSIALVELLVEIYTDGGFLLKSIQPSIFNTRFFTYKQFQFSSRACLWTAGGSRRTQGEHAHSTKQGPTIRTHDLLAVGRQRLLTLRPLWKSCRFYIIFSSISNKLQIFLVLILAESCSFCDDLLQGFSLKRSLFSHQKELIAQSNFLPSVTRKFNSVPRGHHSVSCTFSLRLRGLTRGPLAHLTRSAETCTADNLAILNHL